MICEDAERDVRLHRSRVSLTGERLELVEQEQFVVVEQTFVMLEQRGENDEELVEIELVQRERALGLLAALRVFFGIGLRAFELLGVLGLVDRRSLGGCGRLGVIRRRLAGRSDGGDGGGGGSAFHSEKLIQPTLLHVSTNHDERRERVSRSFAKDKYIYS